MLDSPATELPTDAFPTGDDLLDLVSAGPPAEVEAEIGVDGVPTWVSVDHQPAAIDDEECYRVKGFGSLD